MCNATFSYFLGKGGGKDDRYINGGMDKRDVEALFAQYRCISTPVSGHLRTLIPDHD